MSLATARRTLPYLVLLALALPLGSCGSEGSECERCSSDDDCATGLVCASFSDGSQRCGSGLGETSCRVR